MEFVDFLPAIVTGLVIAPLGSYLKKRMDNLATSNDFTKALEQLEKSTNAVESIKSQLNEKFWVKQQVWDKKRSAYEDVLNSLYLTKKYIEREKSYTEDYHECYVVLNSGYMVEDDEYMNSYDEYVNGERQDFKDKYESETAIQKRKELSDNTHDSYIKLETVFNVKSIYLNSEIKGVEVSLSRLKKMIFHEKFTQYDNEGTDEFLERVMSHNNSCVKIIDEIIMTARQLAERDLFL